MPDSTIEDFKVGSIVYTGQVVHVEETGEYVGRITFKKDGRHVAFDAKALQLVGMSEVLLAIAQRIQLYETPAPAGQGN